MEMVNTKCVIDFDSETPRVEIPGVETIDDIHIPIYNILNIFTAAELKALRDHVIKYDTNMIRNFVLVVFESDTSNEMEEDEVDGLVGDILKLKYCFKQSDLDVLLSIMYLRNTL